MFLRNFLVISVIKMNHKSIFHPVYFNSINWRQNLCNPKGIEIILLEEVFIFLVLISIVLTLKRDIHQNIDTLE